MGDTVAAIVALLEEKTGEVPRVRGKAMSIVIDVGGDDSDAPRIWVVIREGGFIQMDKRQLQLVVDPISSDPCTDLRRAFAALDAWEAANV